MYQEVSKRQKLSWKHIGAGILICFGILFLMNGVAYLVSLHSAWLDLITIFIFTVILYVLLREYFITYRYILIDDEFIIHQVIGSKEKYVLHLHIKQLKKIAPIQELAFEEEYLRSYVKKARFCYTWFQKKDIYYGVYKEGNKEYSFIFQPSKKMLKLLQKKMLTFEE
ncbi:MAG: hypothetical protein GX347_07155 [Epulopiscium sp.]|nr:hypothetical protein [Candidatus Epulonipiscium sp.]